MSRILIVDGNHCCGRSAHVHERLQTSDGRNSGVVYGFMTSLTRVKRILRIANNDICICWDGGRAQKRYDLYPEYKGNRKNNEENVSQLTEQELDSRKQYYEQMQALTKGLHDCGIQQLCETGVEADDIIGIFANLYASNGSTVYIYSGDTDMHQLVTDNIYIMDPKKDIMGKKEIFEYWGLDSLWKIAAFKAMCGDTTDNISGMGGVGEVKATLVLNTLTSVLDKPPLSSDKKTAAAQKLFYANYANYLRNLELMRIPTSMEESFYSMETQISLIDQFSPDTKKFDLTSLVTFLQSWEIKDVSLDAW